MFSILAAYLGLSICVPNASHRAVLKCIKYRKEPGVSTRAAIAISCIVLVGCALLFAALAFLA